MTQMKNHAIKPSDSLPLAGMATVDQDRKTAAGVAQADELTAVMLTPRADISARAGRMERDSPLFFGTGSNPTLF